MDDCSSLITEKDHLKSRILDVCVCLCVRYWLYKPILALNCRLQIEQVNSDCSESDDGPFTVRSGQEIKITPFLCYCTM